MRSYMTDTAENNINYVYLDALEKEFFTEINALGLSTSTHHYTI